MNHPRMTSNGRRLALLIGVVLAFALPKRVECGEPGATCERVESRRGCVAYQLEPWGFYLLERLVDRNVGFAYTSGDQC